MDCGIWWFLIDYDNNKNKNNNDVSSMIMIKYHDCGLWWIMIIMIITIIIAIIDIKKKKHVSWIVEYDGLW